MKLFIAYVRYWCHWVRQLINPWHRTCRMYRVYACGQFDSYLLRIVCEECDKVFYDRGHP